jgi:hypothetical protein
MSYNATDNNMLQREQIGKNYGSFPQEKEEYKNQSSNYDSEDGFCQKLWTPCNITMFVGAMLTILILMILMIAYK